MLDLSLVYSEYPIKKIISLITNCNFVEEHVVKLKGNYTFNAPQDVVWQALLNPEILANVLPGCEKLEKVDENEYKGALKIKVGPVQGLFQGKVLLSDLNEPTSYRIDIEGRGSAGHVNGSGQVRLEAEGNSTTIHYEGEAKVMGRIASVGQRLLDSSAKSITRQSLESLDQQIYAQVNPPATDSSTNGHTPPPPIASPSQTKIVAGVTKDVLDDLIPPEDRPTLMVIALGIFGILFVLNLLGNWWINRIAHRVASVIEKRERKRERKRLRREKGQQRRQEN